MESNSVRVNIVMQMKQRETLKFAPNHEELWENIPWNPQECSPNSSGWERTGLRGLTGGRRVHVRSTIRL